MRTGTDRLKIVCSRCRTLVCYWVADWPPKRGDRRRSCDVQRLDGTPFEPTSDVPKCPTCDIQTRLVRTNEHADS